MDPKLLAWFETIFNVAYLITIWTMVVIMTKNMHNVSEKDRPVAGLIRLAFILLASGDSGHVGFRVIAFAAGGNETMINLFGAPIRLVGLGSLTTAVTVTFFYMLMVYVWQRRYNQKANWLTNLLLASGVVRLMIMMLPVNDWNAIVPPQPIGIIRNIPLMIQGLGIIYLFLKSGYAHNDYTMKAIGWAVVASYFFYTPVILFVNKVPLLGMLMIPKTCAYLVVGWFAYQGLWKKTKKVLKHTKTAAIKSAG